MPLIGRDEALAEVAELLTGDAPGELPAGVGSGITLRRSRMPGFARNWVRCRPLVSFFILACLFSWLIALPLGLLARDGIGSDLFALHYLTAYGPALAVCVVLSVEGDFGSALAALRDRFTRPFSRYWAIVGAGLPVLLFAGAALLQWITSGLWPDLRLIGQVGFLPPLAPISAILLWLVTFGLGEELGWRGFALPRLLQRTGPIRASLILGGCWALWHIPYFLYQPSYRAMGWPGLPVLGVSFVATALVFTWLLLGARGNLTPAVLFHAGFDVVTGSAVGEGLVAAVMSAAVWIGALALLIWWSVRPQDTPGGIA